MFFKKKKKNRKKNRKPKFFWKTLQKQIIHSIHVENVRFRRPNMAAQNKNNTAQKII